MGEPLNVPMQILDLNEHDISYVAGVARQYFGLTTDKQRCGTGSFGTAFQNTEILSRKDYREQVIVATLLKLGLDRDANPYVAVSSGRVYLLRILSAYELAYGETYYGEPSKLLDYVFDDTNGNYYLSRNDLIELMTEYDENGYEERMYSVKRHTNMKVNLD